MGACQIHTLLFLFLLGSSSLTLAVRLDCYKGVHTDIEEDPVSTFNWTTEQVETCDDGEYCQETLLVITAGPKSAVIATKGCVSGTMSQTTFIQHNPTPGLLAVSFANYCEESYCNDKRGIYPSWMLRELAVSTKPTNLYCPTCVALGNCSKAPSLPCPNGSSRCYQGQLKITGGGMDSVVEVQGCIGVNGCRLMSRLFGVGVLEVKEVCPQQTVVQLRKAENGATWLLVSAWGLECLLPPLLLLLQPLIHGS
ncbi:testis-expressed protein 101 [Tenrec ecaudatus]|uniref:testis-expressed protein 101 n=1 Tax=Tenrec ecaudatus TaxID=94439 RepID=UPI003F5A3D46